MNFHTLDYDDSSVSKKFDSPNKISIATMTNLIKVKYSLNLLLLVLIKPMRVNTTVLLCVCV
jgi:hypothetical protein